MLPVDKAVLEGKIEREYVFNGYAATGDQELRGMFFVALVLKNGFAVVGTSPSGAGELSDATAKRLARDRAIGKLWDLVRYSQLGS